MRINTLIPQVFPIFYYMLGANLGSLLYGGISVINFTVLKQRVLGHWATKERIAITLIRLSGRTGLSESLLGSRYGLGFAERRPRATTHLR